MGHHINKQGKFQSDKNPEIKPDHIILDFRDSIAQEALWYYCRLTKDKELAEDIEKRRTR